LTPSRLQEKGIRDACLEAFKHAYLTDGAAAAAEARPLSPEEVAANLIAVADACDAGTLSSDGLSCLYPL